MSDNKLIIPLSGRINSNNADDAERMISSAREASPDATVVLDCELLEYISSAGLRVLLRLRKKAKEVILENVSQEVCGILEVTGFSELFEVHRARRVISVEGCKVIGEGANGKIYRIDSETIVKVYASHDALPEIKRERELARTAFILGIPTAISYDIVRIEGGAYGAVYELLNASGFDELLRSGEKTVEEVARMSVNLLKLIHSTEASRLPDMKQTALGWAESLQPYLSSELYSRLYALIDTVPDSNRILHGDFHIGNMMYMNGESLLIDMDTLCRGNPVFELGSVFNAYRGFGELDHTMVENFFGISYGAAGELWRRSLSLYLGTDDEKAIAQAEEKAMIIGYTRLLRRRIRRGGFETEQGRAEIEHFKKRLEALVPVIDTLII